MRPQPGFCLLALASILALATTSSPPAPARRSTLQKRKNFVPTTNNDPLRPTCFGPVPTHPLPNGDNPALHYVDLTDWCVRGPQHCECVDDPTSDRHMDHHVLYCAQEPPTSPTRERCHDGCSCVAHDVDRYLNALGRAMPALGAAPAPGATA